MAIDASDETAWGPVGVAVLVLLVGLAVSGLALLLARADPYAGRATATGTVVAVHDSGGSCTGIIRYEVAGHAYTVPADVHSATVCAMEGATVQVAYLPERPDGGRALLGADQWSVTGFVAGGMGLAVVGAVQLVRASRGGRAPVLAPAPA